MSDEPAEPPDEAQQNPSEEEAELSNKLANYAKNDLENSTNNNVASVQQIEAQLDTLAEQAESNVLLAQQTTEIAEAALPTENELNDMLDEILELEQQEAQKTHNDN